VRAGRIWATSAAVGTLLVCAIAAAPAGAADGKGCTKLGTSGDDRLKGTAGPDVICAGAGNDQISGLSKGDRVIAGPGDDFLSGGKGPDHLLGGPGDDQMIGGKGRDTVKGGPGQDFCFGPHSDPGCVLEPPSNRPDLQGPQFAQVILPDWVDVSGGPVEVEIRVLASDYAGVRSMELGLAGPGGWGREFSLETIDGVSGYRRTSLTFGPGSTPGVYRVAWLRMTDNLGNVTFATNGVWPLWDPHFEISTEPDGDPPVLQDIQLAPDELDTSTAPGGLYLVARATDDVAGVESVCGTLHYPLGRSVGTCGSFVSGSGTPREGTFAVKFPLPRHAQPGTYLLASIHLRDRAGRVRWVSEDEIEEGGFDMSSQQVGPGDTTPPEILGVSAPSTAVELGTDGKRIINYRLRVREDLSGLVHTQLYDSFFGEMEVQVEGPNGEYYGDSSHQDLVSGTELDGTWAGRINLPAGAPAGTYVLRTVRAEDLAANAATLHHPALAERGWDLSWTNSP
jgi:Ca2+-binding RTX toxin-like protein